MCLSCRGNGSWCGRTPCKLLNEICTAGICGTSPKPVIKVQQAHTSTESDNGHPSPRVSSEYGLPPLVSGEVAVQLLGESDMLTGTASCHGCDLAPHVSPV